MQHYLLPLQKSSLILLLALVAWNCQQGNQKTAVSENITTSLVHPTLTYQKYEPKPTDKITNRLLTKNNLNEFGLANCIAN